MIGNAKSTNRRKVGRPAWRLAALILVASSAVFTIAVEANSAIATPASPATNLVETLIERAQLALRVDPEVSKRDANQALELLKQNPDPDLEIRARLVLCDYLAERDTAAVQREIAAMSSLLPHAKRQGLRAGILDCEGEGLEGTGDNVKAMAQYTQAVSIASDEHDDEMLALSLFARGHLSGAMGDYANGLIESHRADALFEKLKKPLHSMTTLTNIGSLYLGLGDYVGARHIYTRALAEEEKAGLQREQVITLHNLARANENLHDWEAARAAFAKALELSRKINYLRGEGYAMRGLAAVENALGNAQGALEILKTAEELQKQLPDARLRAQIQLARGVALRKLERLPESNAALESALIDFKHGDVLSALNEVYSELAAVSAETGNWRDAYAKHVNAKNASDKLLRNQLDQGLMALKVEFDTADAALRHQNEANERALAQARRVRRLQAMVIILTISIAAGFVVTLLYRYRITHLLELERVRTHIASDLHDDIGSSLSQIAVLSEVVRRQVGETDALSQTLSTIAATSRELVDSMSDIVWAVDPNRDSAGDLALRMRRFASDLFSANNIEFQFDVSETERQIRLDANVRRQIFLIFKESAHNTVRHSKCSKAEIELRMEQHTITLTLRDDGKGFDTTQTHRGRGLSSIAQRARKLGATLNIGSRPGDGTVVSLKVLLARRAAIK